MSKPLRALFFASLTVLLAASSPSASSPGALGAVPTASPGPDLPLSVMTYNVMGLPWPVAFGREEALGQIADRLADLRAQRRQPHILLLQEAFIADPVEFARRAGYAHVAAGPDVAMRSPVTSLPADQAFLQDARWDRGEAIGKRMGSGLLILSDWPIMAVDRIAYPAFACAGFDCLANKGAMIAHLRVPGVAAPVAIVNSHLNARKAAGVPVARSLRAFDRQAGLLTAFVNRHVPRDRMMILGGDFNIGGDRQRIAAFFGHMARASMDFVAPPLGGGRRALGDALLADATERHDLAEAVDRGKDWLFARDAAGSAMPVVQAQVPFGGPEATRLSDHVGYSLSYAPGGDTIRFASLENR